MSFFNVPDVLNDIVAEDVEHRAEHVDLLLREFGSWGLDDEADIGDLADADCLIVEKLAYGLKRRSNDKIEFSDDQKPITLPFVKVTT